MIKKILYFLALPFVLPFKTFVYFASLNKASLKSRKTIYRDLKNALKREITPELSEIPDEKNRKNALIKGVLIRCFFFGGLSLFAGVSLIWGIHKIPLIHLISTGMLFMSLVGFTFFQFHQLFKIVNREKEQTKQVKQVKM